MAGKKQTSISYTPPADKKTSVSFTPQQKRRTAVSENPDGVLEKPIGWNFGKMDSGGKWHCTFRRLTAHRDHLLTFENRKCSEIFRRSGHNHPIAADVVCKTAQHRLKVMGLGDVLLHQLELAEEPGRIWGIMDHNIFHLLWIDPDHTVYPMKH